jgi:hypothetical protein
LRALAALGVGANETGAAALALDLTGRRALVLRTEGLQQLVSGGPAARPQECRIDRSRTVDAR